MPDPEKNDYPKRENAHSMKKIRIATRQSKLALWQSGFIKDQLESHYPMLEVELVGITTEGDRRLDRALSEIGGKGLFIKELEQALLNNQADIAVHSLKDLPSTLSDGFVLAASGFREDVRDALVCSTNSSLESLKQGAVIGSSSLRRQTQLTALRPDFTFQSIRGNVDTRLSKLDAGEYDAIVLAAAGLKRLGLGHRINQTLSVEQSLPCPGQAALGIECCSEAIDVRNLVSVLNDAQVEACILAERAVSRALGGDCSLPLAAYCEREGDELFVRCLLSDAKGKQIIHGSARGKDSELVGAQAAEQLFAQGAGKLLQTLREQKA